MKDYHPLVTPPSSNEDSDGAFRVFEEFLIIYQPALEQAECYLEQFSSIMQTGFSSAYTPWLKAVRELRKGIYLMAKKIPLPDPESFQDALRTFSFDSAAQLIRDICIGCKMRIDANWAKHFRDNILILSQAYRVLRPTQVLQPSR